LDAAPASAPRTKYRSPLAHFDFLGVVAIHGGTIYALYRGASWTLVGLALATYVLRMFAITAVYHRYFGHRAYKTSRPFQFLLALLGTTATQKGPLWWAGTHRLHHKYSDTEKDVHSPMRRGFFWSHMGWWLSREHENSPHDQIRDYAKFPELRFLDRFHLVGPALIIGVTLAFGFDVFLWAYVVSTCALMHGTFTINSLCHVWGSRRYATTDTSRNNPWLAIITLGEGWHNNHHHYMASANQGFFWWEIDVSYYVLRGLQAVGLVWDLRKVPDHVKTRDLLAVVGERAPLLLARQRAAAPAPAPAPSPVAARADEAAA
jgi:stearoyl-CoA desaturase (delta-9 desaturase)